MASSPRPLSRRTFLRGDGQRVARRLVAIQTNQGIMPHLFFPETSGKGYTPSPYLEILKGTLGNLTVFSGISPPGVDGGHANEVCFLTGAPYPAEAGLPHNRVFFDETLIQCTFGESIGEDELPFTLGRESEKNQHFRFTLGAVPLY
jgi:hypothetical protein